MNTNSGLNQIPVREWERRQWTTIPTLDTPCHPIQDSTWVRAIDLERYHSPIWSITGFCGCMMLPMINQESSSEPIDLRILKGLTIDVCITLVRFDRN
jgi:hypothetical protein